MAKKTVKSQDITAIKKAPLDKETVISSMGESFAVADAINGKISKRIATRITRAKEIAQEAKRAFAKFCPSRISAEIRKEVTYLDKGDNFHTAQIKVMEQDLEQMTNYSTMQGVGMTLSKKDLADMEIHIVDGKVTGEVNSAKVQKFLNQKIDHKEFFANRSFLTECRVKKEADEALDKIMNPPAETGGSSPDTQSPGIDKSSDKSKKDITLDQLVKDNVALQMDSVTAPEAGLKFGISSRANQDDIKQATQYFELRGGPADVTAYHDFYDLQIAFRHVWTELFDKKLIEQGEKVFAELSRLKGAYDIEQSHDTVSSVDELKQLMGDLRAARFQIAGVDERFNAVQKLVPEISLEQWAVLDSPTKETLYGLASPPDLSGVSMLSWYDYLHDYFEKQAELIRKILENWKQNKSRVENFLEDLEQRLSERYAFHIFAVDPKGEKASVNYGILVNYRQEWRPLNYQVGELVSTIPLAPKEVRRYSTKRVVKKTRAQQEIEDALNIRKTESSQTCRDHAEIVRDATNKTNFQHNAEGGVNFAVWNAKGSHGVEMNSAKHSSEVKKEFREAVLKAAEEYKNEHKLDITTTASEEIEEVSSGEISNPNDEIPVTYLFYELQRCYEITEKIHKLTPIILVANDVPYPNEIDEDWLLAYDWILRRVILDDSFKPALDYLSDSFVGDEISTEVARNNFETQLDVVGKVSQQVATHAKAIDKAKQALDIALDLYAKSLTKSDSGLFSKISDFLFGGSADTSETIRARMEASKEEFQRAERQEIELRSRLEGEITALESASEKYSKALEKQFNRRTEILRLRAHVKDNILYYMQAIWDQEPPDQRFFRLYHLDAPDISCTAGQEVTLSSKSTVKNIVTGGTEEKVVSYKTLIPGQISITYKKLVEIADLDNLLGYKGNYMIFPLKKNNCVTMFMMQDYIEIQEMARLWDPDEAGNYTVDEMIELIKCYYKNYPASFTPEVKDRYRDLLIRRLMDPHKDKEMVIVPTTSLCIEALPGKHPILEDFKLIHRVVDVKKAQSDVRHAELENVRLAARAVKGEYEDPDIEKKILIEGDAKNINVSPDS